MKVYFAGSIRAGRQDAEIYRQLITGLKEFCEVLTEHVGDELPKTGEDKEVSFIYQRDCRWIDEADVLVAEVTQPSTGVGYEIGYAEANKKPIYCLYRRGGERPLSAMIEGNASCTLIVYETVDEAIARLRKAMNV